MKTLIYTLCTIVVATLCALVLSSCTAQQINQNPGYVQTHCDPNSSLSIIGGANAFNGLNGSITCNGSVTVQWGPVPPAETAP